MLATHDAIVVEAGQDLPAPIRTAVVDDDQLDIAGILDIEHTLHGSGERGCFTVDRHEHG
jgi:hypothetical protein